MIDWDFEARLIDRIAVREAAARLELRERRVLRRRFIYGDSLEDLGERERVSRVRINQIENRAIGKLRDRLAEPPSFDRAAFLRHMQGLIERRETWARVMFAKERASLERLIEREDGPPPPPPPKPAPPIGSTFGTWYHPPQPQQTVEPWFDPARQPTLGDLRCIAQYTLGYFVASRRPMHDGSSSVGKMTTRVLCPRDADAIATAMMQVKAAIPHSARLSAALLDVPKDILAVTLGCPFVALRVASVEEGKRVSIEVTWDE